MFYPFFQYKMFIFTYSILPDKYCKRKSHERTFNRKIIWSSQGFKY